MSERVRHGHCAAKAWSQNAIHILDAEGRRTADSHLCTIQLPGFTGIDIYFKDESIHPTGSLKHRLARSLLLYGICNGDIGKDTVLVEASSGSTAVSEAYYACLLGLTFYAVLPRTTSKSKVEAIKQHGGLCHFVDEPSTIYAEAASLAERHGGYFLDQFAHAERATDWRGNNNIAESILNQLSLEPHPVPHWIVMAAGTGGTSATLGRYILYRGLDTRLCVPDPENSVFFSGWRNCDRTSVASQASRIEGIGRPRMEPSFIANVVDTMLKIPDAASIAACRVLSRHLSRRVGGSTGTNFLGVLWAAAEMQRQDETGSIVSVICDSGERYADTYFDGAWLEGQKLDIAGPTELINRAIATGDVSPELFIAIGQRDHGQSGEAR